MWMIIFTSLTLATILAFSSILAFLAYNVSVDPKLCIVQLYGLISATIMMNHISIGMIGIRQRFEKLSSFLNSNPNLEEKTLKKLSELHLMICQLLKIFNKIYGPLLVLIVACCFAWFCIFIFGLAMTDVQFMKKYFFLVIFNFILNLIFTSLIFFMMHFAERVYAEGKSPKIFLYQILNKKNDFKTREIISNFIYQIDNSEMKVSTGFFDLDYKFMFHVS
jgi:hypothetical protein